MFTNGGRKSIDFFENILYNIWRIVCKAPRFDQVRKDMKIMMKKLLALLLALLTVATFSACSNEEENNEDLSNFRQEEIVFTSVTNEYGTFHFELLTSDTVEITKYEGSTDLHEVVVPATVHTGEDVAATSKKVTTIGKDAFKGVSAITAITLPEGITTIGNYAFADCAQLATVSFPSTLASIGQGAFRSSGLTTLVFPESCALTEIAVSAFSNCLKLESLTIPGYITTIRQGAFLGCSGLKTLVLSEGVSVVENQAFQGTVSLASLTLPSTFVNTDPMDDLVFSGSKVLYRENIICPADSAAAAYADKMPLSSAPEVAA